MTSIRKPSPHALHSEFESEVTYLGENTSSSGTHKAANLLGVLVRLGNSNGGMSPLALRFLYTGAIRPTFTWGAELFNRPKIANKIEPMRRLEYKALRKITGGYHGSSHEKLGWIANIPY